MSEEVTPRQRELLAIYGNGFTLHEIADKIHLSYHTVRNTLDEAKERIGAKSLPHAVAIAIRDGIIVFDSNGDTVVADK
jgi:DNA-binding CsgD family transcriptional regulator